MRGHRQPGAPRRTRRLCLAAAALLALSACDKPKWRDAGKPPPAPAAAPAAPKARVIPNVEGRTPPPSWANTVIGRPLRDAYPKAGICKGNTDMVQQTYSGDPAGVQIHGWGFDLGAKARIARVVLVDQEQRIVGAGEGGVQRLDVIDNIPEIKDSNTGWNADLPRTTGPVDAYGVVEGGAAVCPLGHMDF